MVKCSREKCYGVVDPSSGRCYVCGHEAIRYESLSPEQEMDEIGITSDMERGMYEKLWPHPITVKAKTELTGLSSSYYELPEGCKELQDLIEYKQMNFSRGNIFKAAYRLGDKPGTEAIYDLEKIIWFAQREIERLKNLEKEQE